MNYGAGSIIVGPNVEFVDKGLDRPKRRTLKSVWLKDFVQTRP